MPRIIDDAGLFERIQLANQVIKVVQGLLGDTPLNRRGKLEEIEALTVDVLGDMNTFYKVVATRNYFHSRSTKQRAREAKQRHTQRLTGQQIRGIYNDNTPAHRPQVVIASLSVPQSKGMCQEYAALAYGMLRHLLPATDNICYVYSSAITHYFCTIGDHDQRDQLGDRLIVVDPWYTKAEAVLWNHSDHKKNGYKGNVIYCKPGKGNGNLNACVVNDALARQLIASARHSYQGRFGTVGAYDADIEKTMQGVPEVVRSAETLHLHDRKQYPGHISTFADSDDYVGYEYRGRG